MAQYLIGRVEIKKLQLIFQLSMWWHIWKGKAACTGEVPKHQNG